MSVYVHVIEMTVYAKKTCDQLGVMSGTQVDVVRVTKERLSYIEEIDMLDVWFKLNPFGLVDLGCDTLEYSAKLMGGEEHVYTTYTGDKAILSLTTYKKGVV